MAKIRSLDLDIKGYMKKLGMQARVASREMSRASTKSKNHALLTIASGIRDAADILKTQNDLDLVAGKAKGLDAALLDRLELTDSRIEAMAEGLEQIANLADPIGCCRSLFKIR
jgi:glutamate-5-semialdehyde dehydrogenase